MIAQIICFTQNPPNPEEAKLISTLTASGHTPMVDSVHSHKAWFVNNFQNVHHQVYYNKPFPHLLSGDIKDVDFEIMGCPHFVVYYTTIADGGPVPDAHEWRCITKFLSLLLNGEEDETSDEDLKIGQICLGASKQMEAENVVEEVTEVGEFVIERSLEDYYYKFESKFIKEADLMIYQVTKPFTPRPFTVLIEKFSTKGAGSLFTDLFSCNDWGKEHLDVRFLESLWTHLGLLDDAPFDMQEMLRNATEACYPNESCEIQSEPRVYRKSIGEMEQVYGAKFN